MPLFCTCSSCTGQPYDEDYEDESYDDESSGGLINPYSYKPDPVFHGDGPLYLGTEIEVATDYGDQSRLARTAVDTLGDLAYLKEDGSFGDGFEIVTHPMSYAYAMASFPWDLLPALANGGAMATEETGIHVHVNRDGFSNPCHMYRWMKLIYRNRAEVVRVAGRESSQWAPFSNSERRAIKEYVKPRSSDRRYASRYNAINVTNRSTLELRIFAGSLRPRKVQAALGFTAASVEYTRQLTAYDVSHNGGWTWPAFTSWVAPQPQYEPLVARMDRLDLLTGQESLSCAF